MVLSCIERTDPGYDKRSFRCAIRGLQDSITVKIESAATTSITQVARDPSSHKVAGAGRDQGRRKLLQAQETAVDLEARKPYLATPWPVPEPLTGL
jgi:hypothetical protein